jgi:hypothetical protein|tara:strand:- start:218 stop:967 length:750 start_codon:yes stop_codon:yes gene_type:complete
MSEQESELPNIKVYQPWSAPLLHFRLSDEQIEDLLEITDLALEDKNTKSYNDKLAGEIEGEWEIPDYEDLSEVLNLPTISSQYFQVLASQNLIEIEGENTTMSQHLALFAQNLDKSILISAWFNDQKDDEYNPAHDHTGVLSGVLYLKIPEYLPSRKHHNADGSIVFISNECKTDGIMTNSTLLLSPEVGDLFLFSSSLKHQVYPFRTADKKGIRRSLSFNMGHKTLSHEDLEKLMQKKIQLGDKKING